MRTRSMTHARLVALALAVLVSACASVPLKQKAVVGVQAAHAAVASAQDSERAFYAAKTIPGLTPELHGKFAKFFDDYFTAEQKVDTALLAWRAGDPVPTDLKSALTDLNGALDAASALTDGANKSSLLGKLNAAIAQVQHAIAVLGGVN